MIDYYVKLVGEDHVAIATDDMFDVSLVVDFAKKNAAMYNDGGYMIDAFNKGADDSAPLSLKDFGSCDGRPLGARLHQRTACQDLRRQQDARLPARLGRRTGGPVGK